MLYTEAFRKLGYDLKNQRQDWSAIRDGGVCLALWRSQLGWDRQAKVSVFDAEPVSAGDPLLEGPGHKKRATHLTRAIDEFDRWIDVVLVDGTPGERNKGAEPWVRDDSWWRITNFDPKTGYFKCQVFERE